MAFEQRDNSGALFNNERKQSDKHPDRTGTAMIGGEMYYVDGWLKEGKNGRFLSLSFKRKEAKPERSSSGLRRSRDEMRTDGHHDDIPF